MRRLALVLAVAVTLGACAQRKQDVPATPAPPPSQAAPVPPAGAAPGLTVPDPDAPTINSDLAAGPALWHVRAALNVAALGCGMSHPEVVAGYNRLLDEREAVLATAYAAEKARFGARPAELDDHMTQLYNFFAQPPAQREFCPVAARVVTRLVAAPAASLPEMAPAALVELEAPVRNYYRAYAGYQRDLAAWQQGQATAVAAAAPPPPPQPAPAVATAALSAPASAWRIQIGAFTGQAAAEAAWRTAQRRAPSLAAYQPVYEKVEGSPLVRLQVGAASDRDGALRLCATAAAGGFDCIPRRR